MSSTPGLTRAFEALTGRISDHDATLGVSLVGGLVDSWADQSGQGHTLAAPDAPHRPAVGSIGGYTSIRFDNGPLLGGALAGLVARPEVTMAVVCAITAAGGDPENQVISALTVGNNINAGLALIYENVTGSNLHHVAWRAIEGGGPADTVRQESLDYGTLHLWTAQHAFGARALQRDGAGVPQGLQVSMGTSPQNVDAITRQCVGAEESIGAWTISMHLLRRILFSRVLTLDELAIVHAYLADRYGLTLPAAVPEPPASISVNCTEYYPRQYVYPVCGVGDDPVTLPGVTDLLTVDSEAEADAARAAFVSYVWGVSGLPSGNPDVVDLNVAEARLSVSNYGWTLPMVGQIDRYTFNLPFGITHYGWRVRPASGARNRLVIYHSGHNQAVNDPITQHVYTQLCAAGFDVVLLFMPLYADNTNGTYNGNPLSIAAGEHASFDLPEIDRATLGYSAIRVFIEPVIRTLNLLAGSFEHVAMMGLSGGGWTTEVCAALDDRINASYLVAGSGIYIGGVNGLGWEDRLGGPLNAISSEDRLVMAADREGRRQLEILGPYDTTTPASGQYIYRRAMQARSRALGGVWSPTQDPTYTGHTVSAAAMATIRRDLVQIDDHDAARTSWAAANRQAATA